MSGDLNTVIISGNITRDPWVYEGTSPFARISIAQTYWTKDGKKSRFTDVMASDKLAENVKSQLSKGDYIIITGKVVNKKPMDGADGKKIYSSGVYMDSFRRVARSNSAIEHAAVVEDVTEANPYDHEDVPLD